LEDLLSIGARVADVRAQLRMSQQDIADMIGISLRAWQHMERDERVPSGEALLLFKK